MCVCMYVYMYIYICTYVYMYMFVCVCVCVYIYIYTQIHIFSLHGKTPPVLPHMQVVKIISSSSHICHGVGPLVDPFRSHVQRSLFKGLP